HVAAVGQRPGHDLGDVDSRLRPSDELVLVDGLRRRLARLQAGTQEALEHSQVVALHLLRDRDVEELAADELAIGDGLTSAGDDALVDGQLRNGKAETRRRET